MPRGSDLPPSSGPGRSDRSPSSGPGRSDRSPSRETSSGATRWLWRGVTVAALLGAVFWYGPYLGFQISRAVGIGVIIVGLAIGAVLVLVYRDRERTFRRRGEQLERDVLRGGVRLHQDAPRDGETMERRSPRAGDQPRHDPPSR